VIGASGTVRQPRNRSSIFSAKSWCFVFNASSALAASRMSRSVESRSSASRASHLTAARSNFGLPVRA
jgi:hypothetical protein